MYVVESRGAEGVECYDCDGKDGSETSCSEGS
jgi:hypothetical protein